MTIVDMLKQSGILTLLGMGVVLGFLIVMIIVISHMGKIVSRQKSGEAPAAAANSTPQAAGDGGAVIAAISAAVNEYRKDESR